MRRDPIAKLIRAAHRGTGLRLSSTELRILTDELGIGKGPATLPDEDELRAIAAEQGCELLPPRDDKRGV